MKIILIGNGSSVLDRVLGERIDEFDRIVRFNSYKIHGYEEFVGTKTTDWFNVQLLESNDFRVNQQYKKYVFHSWKWNDVGHSIVEMNSLIKADEKGYTDKNIIEEMAAFCKDSHYKWFSTGAIAAWQYLKEYESITIHGFDWWDREKHHYGDNQVRGSIHSPQKEFLFFKKLGNRIKNL